MDDNLISKIKNEKDDYGSIPFWSWNDKLDKKRLCEQIDDMKNIGMSGFFMHARSGLETEYLSDEWYDCIKECVDHAKELGMQAWSYDENGWPSGFAGGKLLEDPVNYAHYLKYEVLDHFDPDAFGVYVIINNQISHISEPINGINEFHTIYMHDDDSYVDTMDLSITKKFIEATHEDYKKKLGDDFGNAMPGFFTDEPQYYRWGTVWSNTLPTEFMNRFGYDVMSALPALFIDFDGAQEYRYDYHLLCHELFINNFIKPIYEWGLENNCKLTGHAIEEKTLTGQMWCCGGIMPFYEYMDIPGVDFLGDYIPNDMSSKQAGSVCAQLGKPRLLSEMYACCGWDVSPLILKRIAEHQYYGGVNLMCQHLYPYSERGQRKRDYPAHYSEHLPWQEKLAEFNEYFNRLGCTLNQGKEITNVLVIHPIHSAYLNYKREVDMPSIHELEENFSYTLDLMSQNQVAYHLGDEKLMERYARVEGDKITVGKCTYDTVVLPLLYTLDANTANLLKEFISNGGKVCAPFDLPNRIDGRIADLSWLKSTVSIDDVISTSPAKAKMNDEKVDRLRIMYRETTDGKLFYALNQARFALKDVEIEFRGVENIAILDIDSLDYKYVEYTKTNDGVKVVIDFDAVESFIFVGKQVQPTPKIEFAPIEITKVINTEYEQNAYTLDYADLSKDGENWTTNLPVMQIKDNLLKEKYEGKVWLKFHIRSNCEINDYGVVLEPMNYTEITINGNELVKTDATWFDKSFNIYRSSLPLKMGDNELVIAFEYFQRDYVYHVLYDGVSESLRNCLCFDTEIEVPYLIGDFACETESDKFTFDQEFNRYDYSGSFVLDKSHPVSNIKETNKDGFAFYNGKFKFEIKHGKGNMLAIPGSYPVCDVLLNEKLYKTLMFKNYVVFDHEIEENDIIEIVVYGTNRNAMGHHHWIGINDYSVPPYFSFEGQWDGDKCPNYKPTYTFQRFGLDI